MKTSKPGKAVVALEHLGRETGALFGSLTEYLMKMDGGIRLSKEEHFQNFNRMIGGEYEEWFLEDEGLAEDAITGFLAEERRIYEEQLPKLLRYSFIVLTATVAERQIRLLGAILGGAFSEQMKSIAGARKVLHDSTEYAKLTAPPNDSGWETLRRLAEVRNCIAHAHGFVNDMSEKQRNGLRTFVTEKRDWQGLRIGPQGELIPGDYIFQGEPIPGDNIVRKLPINFSFWVHKEAGRVVGRVIAGTIELCR